MYLDFMTILISVFEYSSLPFSLLSQVFVLLEGLVNQKCETKRYDEDAANEMGFYGI